MMDKNVLPEHFYTKKGKFDRKWNFTHEYYNYICSTYNSIPKKRDREIIRMCFVENRSTYDTLRIILAMPEEKQVLFYSNQGKVLSIRSLQGILKKYYPDYMSDNAVIDKRKKSRRINRERYEKIGGYEEALSKVKSYKRCAMCNCEENLDIHHMIPFSYGGTTDSRNLICLCEDCHKSVTQYHQELRRNANEKTA